MGSERANVAGRTALRAASLAASLALALVAAPRAGACGFHDQALIERGMMNWAYPNSLHVRAAVWSAQQAGAVERAEPSYETVALMLTALRKYLPGRASVVLLTPMLWARYSPGGTQVHSDGPAPGDVVYVTEAAVVEAIVLRRMTLDDALAGGLVRLYPSH